MSTEELEQAVFEAKWSGVEADATEVIARALELDRSIVERVLCAAKAARKYSFGDFGKNMTHMHSHDEGVALSEELRNAISFQVRRGLARVMVRWSIQNMQPLFIKADKLIKDPIDICSGCPLSFQCVSQSYSTPIDCYTKGPPIKTRTLKDVGLVTLERFPDGRALVRPERIKKDKVTVTCMHPKGTFVVDAQDLSQ